MVSRRFVFRMLVGIAAGEFGVRWASAQREPTFYVLGFVQKPGAYRLNDPTTVGDALYLAGGFDPKHTVTGIDIVRVVDGEKQTLNASFTDPVIANDTLRVR